MSLVVLRFWHQVARCSLIVTRLTFAPAYGMSNQRTACDPVQDFARPSLGFRCSTAAYVQATSPYFDNLRFDIFMKAVLSVTYFITSVSRAVRFLYVL